MWGRALTCALLPVRSLNPLKRPAAQWAREILHNDRLGVDCTAFTASIFQLCGNTGTNSDEKASPYTNFSTIVSTTTAIDSFSTRWSSSVHLLLHSSEFFDLDFHCNAKCKQNEMKWTEWKVWNQNRLSPGRRHRPHVFSQNLSFHICYIYSLHILYVYNVHSKWQFKHLIIHYSINDKLTIALRRRKFGAEQYFHF